MLVGLRARAIIGGDDEQRGIDLAGADQHVADELVVTGDVDEVDRLAAVDVEMRVAHVDRHATPSLLGEAIRVDAGQGMQQRRLAVIDVAGRADDDGHPSLARAARTAAMTVASSDGSTVRRSRTTWPRSIRPMSGGSPSRNAPRSADAFDRRSSMPADGSVSPGSEPPPTVASRSTVVAPSPIASAIAVARCWTSATGIASIRHTGISRTARPDRYNPSVRATPAIVDLSGRIARASGSRRMRAMRSARPTTRPACGPPTSLSPLKVTTSEPA